MYPPPGYPQQPPAGEPQQPAQRTEQTAMPDVKLPDPASTGAKPREPAKPAGDAAAADAAKKSNQTVPESAAKIIQQYLQRRPTST
jgi:hypothetical protein